MVIKTNVAEFQTAIEQARKTSKDAFFTWFDKADPKDNADTAFVAGQWNFASHMAPSLHQYINNTEKKTILEIGYGGGRLLAAAARYFHMVIGVDIHNCSDLVSEELKKRGVTNAQLLQGDGKTLPVSPASVDAVYSFIVLQHVGSIDIFHEYMKETYRVLKKDGITVLYFGRYCRCSLNKRLPLFYYVDRCLEIIALPRGYKEVQAPVNCINLLVTLHHAKKYAKRLGFTVLDTLVSRKIPEGNTYGLQHGLVLKKIEEKS